MAQHSVTRSELLVTFLNDIHGDISELWTLTMDDSNSIRFDVLGLDAKLRVIEELRKRRGGSIATSVVIDFIYLVEIAIIDEDLADFGSDWQGMKDYMVSTLRNPHALLALFGCNMFKLGPMVPHAGELHEREGIPCGFCIYQNLWRLVCLFCLGWAHREFESKYCLTIWNAKGMPRRIPKHPRCRLPSASYSLDC